MIARSEQEFPLPECDVTKVLSEQYELEIHQAQLLVAARGKSVWKVDTSQGVFALKIYRHGDFSALDDEVKAMTMGAGILHCVPGHRFPNYRLDPPSLLTEWIDGRSLRTTARSSPWLAHRLGKSFGRLLARLHNESGKTRTDGACFLHLDYHSENAIVRDNEIVAIVDWRNARFGNPLADIARTWLLACGPLAAPRSRPFARICDRAFIHGWWRGYMSDANLPDGLDGYLERSVAELAEEGGQRSRHRLERAAARLLQLASHRGR